MWSEHSLILESMINPSLFDFQNYIFGVHGFRFNGKKLLQFQGMIDSQYFYQKFYVFVVIAKDGHIVTTIHEIDDVAQTFLTFEIVDFNRQWIVYAELHVFL